MPATRCTLHSSDVIRMIKWNDWIKAYVAAARIEKCFWIWGKIGVIVWISVNNADNTLKFFISIFLNFMIFYSVLVAVLLRDICTLSFNIYMYINTPACSYVRTYACVCICVRRRFFFWLFTTHFHFTISSAFIP